MEGKSPVWHLKTALGHGARQEAVPRPRNGPRILEMMTPAVSTQWGEDDVVITNFIVVKFSGGCAGWRHDLYNHENLLQGENDERIPRDRHRRLRQVSRTRVCWMAPRPVQL